VKIIHYESNGQVDSLAVDDFSGGRAPNGRLESEAVGVEYDKKGVVVNDRLQTTNPRIYAGDVCMHNSICPDAAAAL